MALDIDWGGPVNPQPLYQPLPIVSAPAQERIDWGSPVNNQPGYTGLPSLPAAESVNPTGLFVNTPNSSSGDWWDKVFDWAVSDTGLKTIGGVAAGALGAYQQSRNREAMKDDGPSAAELQHARYAKHNASINAPMNMGMLKLKR